MKIQKLPNRLDLYFILGAALFFLSCIATTLQTAKTLAPRQGQFSGGYLQGRSLDEFSADPVQLIGVNARLGVARNFDAGVGHTFDVSKDNEATYNTVWGDVKYQFSNHGNQNLKLSFSSGLQKGYVYDESADVHITTLPLYFSLPVSNRLTPTFTYRYDLLSDGFFPNSESFDDPRHSFILGVEYALKEPDATKWIPKIAFAIGRMNSLDGDPESSPVLMFNFGLKFDSPFSSKAE